jgi:hypothetical protein
LDHKAEGGGRPRARSRQLAERRAASRAAWARQHPDIAAAERSLRKARAELVEPRWKHKNEGTPETHEQASRRNQGALVRLYQTGAIDAEQLASAVEIALVHERIGRDVAVRTASLETRVDVTRIGDGGFFERLGQVRREYAYTEWRQRCAAGAGARHAGRRAGRLHGRRRAVPDAQPAGEASC